MKKHTILYLAANPSGTDLRALDREARAIQAELERSSFRDRFELVTRWAVEPLDVIRELRDLKPTVVHFSGHGGADGLRFQTEAGRAQLVAPSALAEAFGAAGASVKLVVLSACYSEVQADALLAHVDHVVGIGGSVHEDAARIFAIGFYGGLAGRESIADAFRQGRAAIELQGLPDGDRPQLRGRDGDNDGRLILAEAAAPEPEALPSGPRPERHPNPGDTPIRVSGSALGDGPSMTSFSTEELARAELAAAEIVTVRRPAPASRNKVIVMASIGAGLFVLLLLVIPHDIISPPAPVGTPQIVLGASALTACALWALNPRRRYLRFAVSLLVVIVVPASPVWPLLSELGGGAAPSAGLPVVTQIAMIGVVCLCLVLDYRTHREQDTLQRGLGQTLDKLAFSRQLKVPFDVERYQSEIVDLTDRYKLIRTQERHGLMIGVAVLLCSTAWRIVDVVSQSTPPTSSVLASEEAPDAAAGWPPAVDGPVSDVTESNDPTLPADASTSGASRTSRASAQPNLPPDARPEIRGGGEEPLDARTGTDRGIELPKELSRSAKRALVKIELMIDESGKSVDPESLVRVIARLIANKGYLPTTSSGLPSAADLVSYRLQAFILHVKVTSIATTVDDSTASSNCKLIMAVTRWTGDHSTAMATVSGGAKVRSGKRNQDIKFAIKDCVEAVSEDVVTRQVLPTLESAITRKVP